MDKHKTMTATQFAEDYAARSGVDLKFLADQDYVVCSCDCEWSTCKGWVMESDNYIQNCIQGEIPLPNEMHYLKGMKA